MIWLLQITVVRKETQVGGGGQTVRDLTSTHISALLFGILTQPNCYLKSYAMYNLITIYDSLYPMIIQWSFNSPYFLDILKYLQTKLCLELSLN